MFRWIIGSSLKFRFLVLAAAAALLVFGTQQLRKMPVDVFPEFAPPKVEIQTEGPGMTSVEVEELITIPMEDALRGTPGVEYVRSSSVTGLSQVVLHLQDGHRSHGGAPARAGAREARHRRAAAVVRHAGHAAAAVLDQPRHEDRALVEGLRHDGPVDDRLLDDQVPAACRSPAWPTFPSGASGSSRCRCRSDPSLMRAHNVTLDEVMETTSDALDFGLLRYSTAAKTRIDGMLDTPNQRLVIHHESPVFSPEHLAAGAGRARRAGAPDPPRLGDVATVTWDTWPMVGDAVINDERRPDDDRREAAVGQYAGRHARRRGGARRAAARSARHRDRLHDLPAGDLHRAVDRQPDAWRSSSARILVVIVLGAFLYEWRVALISVIAIPLSLVAAGVVLYFQGATINTMVLAGFIVALGSVVDDAIIDVENIVRRLRQHRQAGSDKSTARIILEASLEVRPAIVHATVIIVLAVTPVFFMGGLSGAFFEPLALAFILAMLASMVVALTVTPALCLMLLNRAAHRAPGVAAGAVAQAQLRRAAFARRSQAPRATYVGAARLRRRRHRGVAVPRRSRCCPRSRNGTS